MAAPVPVEEGTHSRQVSTHSAFCDLLQKLERGNRLSMNTNGTVGAAADAHRQPTAPLPPAKHRPQISPTEQKPTPQLVAAESADPTGALPRHNTLVPFYVQMVKETVTAFAGQQLYAQLLFHGDHTTGESAEGRHQRRGVAAVQQPSTAELQVVLRQGMLSFVQTVVQEEAAMQKLSADCRAYPTFSSPKLTNRAREYASMRQVPLRCWAGVHRYNNRFVRCSLSAVGSDADAHQRKQGKRAFHKTVQVSKAAATTTTNTAPAPLALPADIETELRKYWKLHDEAAARARLEALRSHDTQAFAEHVSLLKVSALLEIMERTEAFMRHIGLRLELQAANTLPQQTAQQEERCGVLQKTAPHANAASRRGDDDYARFRAYVASTKNEFKLVHRVDAFVAAQPAGLKATLLPHQMDGLRFLASLHANHINGILADEMGVGKTLQTLAFLLHLRKHEAEPSVAAGDSDSAALRRPHLVLAPLSVVREWREACEQFVTASFRVAVFQELTDPLHEAATYDLILMPVHAVRHVGATAARLQWNYVVVDEAHKAVANLNTFTAQAIVALPCARRLVLTGTPLSSDLQELWSLLHFLNPHVFSNSDAFEEVFRRPFHVYEAKEVELTTEERGLLVLRLHQVLRPFLLRRTKADVDVSLRMTFHRVQCPLSLVQQRVLTMLRKGKRVPAVRAGNPSDSEEEAQQSESVSALSPELALASGALTQLVSRHFPGLAASSAASLHFHRAARLDRALCLSCSNISESTAQQVCNHAFLLPFFSLLLHRHGMDERTLEYAAEGLHEKRGAAAMSLCCSGKFLLLHLLLSRLVVAGRKAVLFTHWLSCVDLLVDYLASRGWEAHTEVLTGGNSEAERKASVRRFHDDPTCLFFVLSIKAGGCGINLQSAHMVILLDRDYTATNEDQALARVYRIGQRHTVRALYISTDDASESRVAQRAEEKNRPRRAIIDGGVYQLTERGESGAQSEEVEEGEGEAQRQGKSGGGGDDGPQAGGAETTIATEQLWGMLTAARQGTVLSRNHTEAAEATQTTADPVTSAQFWTTLRHLVSSLDDLVLTEEDRKTGAKAALVVNEGAPTGTGRTSPSSSESGLQLCSLEESSALSRLHRTRPPESLASLECELRMVAAAAQVDAATTPHNQSLKLSVDRGASPDAASAMPTDEQTDAATTGSAEQDGKVQVAKADAGASSTSSSATSTVPPCALDPLHCPAPFWAEFTYLLQLANDGPRALCAALDMAVANDQKSEDPAAQLRRRQRRDSRAAKRLRLATVEVPDTFREKCWADGVDEEDEEAVVERYLRHLDARAAVGRSKRRKADVGAEPSARGQL